MIDDPLLKHAKARIAVEAATRDGALHAGDDT
jgi:hypothetical protein